MHIIINLLYIIYNVYVWFIVMYFFVKWFIVMYFFLLKIHCKINSIILWFIVKINTLYISNQIVFIFCKKKHSIYDGKRINYISNIGNLFKSYSKMISRSKGVTKLSTMTNQIRKSLCEYKIDHSTCIKKIRSCDNSEIFGCNKKS